MSSELWKQLKRRMFVEAKGLSEIHSDHPKYELTRKSTFYTLFIHESILFINGAMPK